MADRNYDSDEGEFVDFGTLDDWRERDIAKDKHIATLQAENARLREALVEIGSSDSDYPINPHSNEGRVLGVCKDIARAALSADDRKEEDGG